jgi:hypothetical protein
MVATMHAALVVRWQMRILRACALPCSRMADVLPSARRWLVTVH